MKKLTTKEFIKRAKETHGNRYDYSESVYKGARTKIKIICKIHGEFEQIPDNHVNSVRGCSMCGMDKVSNIMRSTTEEFIKKVKKIHGNKYDYSKVNYINNCTEVIVICPTHGEFLQIPYVHISGCGCGICGRKECKKQQTSNTQDFIKKSQKMHGKFYDYSKVKYINSLIKIEIVCPIHGIFWQTPPNHIRGCGCSKCSNVGISNTNDFIQKSKLIHGNKYDYNKVNYITAQKKVEIICYKHGSFYQKPNNHLQKKGCPKCSHIISKPETEFLNHLNILTRNYTLPEWKLKRADGYDEKSNTIYEFLGDYWHGNPKIFNKNDVNTRAHKTFGELYKNTIKMLNRLKSFGYNIKYIWESDWDYFRNGKTDTLSVISY